MLLFKTLLHPFKGMAEKSKYYENLDNNNPIKKMVKLSISILPIVVISFLYVSSLVVLFFSFIQEAIQDFFTKISGTKPIGGGLTEISLSGDSLSLLATMILPATFVIIISSILLGAYFKTKISKWLGGAGTIYNQSLMNIYSWYVIMLMNLCVYVLTPIIGSISDHLITILLIISFVMYPVYLSASISASQKINGIKAFAVLSLSSIAIALFYGLLLFIAKIIFL